MYTMSRKKGFHVSSHKRVRQTHFHGSFYIRSGVKDSRIAEFVVFMQDDGLMIVCDVCSTWQHAVCFRIIDEEHAPEEHVCNVCAKVRIELQCFLFGFISLVFA
jgi:hypothetical protein